MSHRCRTDLNEDHRPTMTACRFYKSLQIDTYISSTLCKTKSHDRFIVSLSVGEKECFNLYQDEAPKIFLAQTLSVVLRLRSVSHFYSHQQLVHCELVKSSSVFSLLLAGIIGHRHREEEISIRMPRRVIARHDLLTNPP